MLKLFFHLVNIIFIIFYLFPGSILGFLFYGDFYKQPQLTGDFNFNFLEISSNHIYAFIFLSLFGFLNYFKNNRNFITIYLLFIAIILELLHFMIPQRSFQISDLYGNIFGVLISLILINIFYYAKKNSN